MASNPDEAKGRIKEAVGDLTDNDDMKREGKVDQATGKAKEAMDNVGDAAKRTVDKARDAVNED